MEKDFEDKLALFDMDGTLADYHGAIIRDLKKIGFKDIPYNFSDFSKNTSAEFYNAINLIKNQAGWWESLEPIQSGIEIMKICRKIGFRIGILTQSSRFANNSWGEKYAWCEKYVKPIDPDYIINITRGGKGYFYGRVFVDDFVPFMNAWLEHRPRGLGLMPLNESNKDFKHKNIIKYNPQKGKWKTNEVVNALKYAYSRESGKN